MLLCAMKLAFIVLPLDRATATTIHSLLPKKNVEIVPNPIDLAMLPMPTHQSSRKKTLLFLGWILPSKGVEDLLAAWGKLTCENWNLVLAGPGDLSYRNELINRFMPHNVSFTGELPHEIALQLIADCDLFVLPSHTEGFPFVVLEAMSLGKAIVASDVGGIPQMLAGESGVLFTPKDVKGLSAALESLIEDADLRGKIGSRARERALANYTVDAVFGRLLKIWQQTV
jgi:glycosyltransferase involved in cell wall biosynthesis